jgi:Secretion system C-terminal sorting domain
MKRNLLLILIFLVSCTIYGQTYKPLLLDGNKWNNLYEPHATGWKCSKIYSSMDSTGTEVLKLSLDTTINGIKYKNLLVSYDSIISKVDTLGLIREDTIYHRVYFWSRNYRMYDSLLYDFNVKIKDTVLDYTVDSIDSIMIGKYLYKRIRLNNGVDWIEGIGATNGLVSSTIPMPLCGTYYSRTLLCFYSHDSLFYQPNIVEYKYCFYRTTYVGINSKVYQINYTLYPNPAKDNITINSNNDEHCILEIMDTQGQILISMKLLNQSNHIDLQRFQSGFYFVRITNNKNIFTYKIIKK